MLPKPRIEKRRGQWILTIDRHRDEHTIVWCASWREAFEELVRVDPRQPILLRQRGNINPHWQQLRWPR